MLRHKRVEAGVFIVASGTRQKISRLLPRRRRVVAKATERSGFLNRLDVTQQASDLGWLQRPFRHAVMPGDHAFGERLRQTADRIVAAQIAERRSISHGTLCVTRNRVAGSALLFRHPLPRCNFRRRGAKILFFPVRRVRTGDEPQGATPDRAREEKESEQSCLRQSRGRLRTVAQLVVYDKAA